MRKGIILAGGTGSRLHPATIVVNKQLIPVYDKPMIYYSLSTLMQAKCRDILLISSKKYLPLYKKLFGSGSEIGINIKYKIQPKPNGIAQAFLIGEKFLNKSKCILILGDNIFWGNHIEKLLKNNIDNSGATIFLYNVNNPDSYGVAQIKKNVIKKIVEKPKKFISNKAITGLYFFDEKVSAYAKKLKFSLRGELEITDLINKYLENNELSYEIFDKGNAWLDAGSHSDLIESSMYVKTIQKRLGLMIGSIHEISYQNKWITKKKLNRIIEKLGRNDYSEYLKKL
tara:strand:- start:3476 stop:4330 length:855 start_codon:yes stop_codon:yes gene_type:complete